MTDDTRACLGLVGALASADEVATWRDWNAADMDKKAVVEAFSEQVKAARASYNNVLKDEAQAALFGEENAAKLIAIEEQLRTVKAHFNIPVYVTAVATSKTSAHKATYTEGEKFDWTGLVLTITYDDGSTKDVTPESGLLKITEEYDGVALTHYDQYVKVGYTENGTTIFAYVEITVNERELSSIEEHPEEANVMKNVLIFGGAAIALVGVAGVFVILTINKRKRAKAAATAHAVETSDLSEAAQTPDTEAEQADAVETSDSSEDAQTPDTEAAATADAVETSDLSEAAQTLDTEAEEKSEDVATTGGEAPQE